MTERFDIEAFEERSSIIEYDGGLSRFEAETLAAKAQGLTRWQAMEAARNAKRIGNPAKARDQREAAQRHRPHHMPAVQPAPAEQNGPVFERELQARWDRVELLALRGERR